MSKKPANDAWLVVGRILKPFQLKGLIKIESYCEDPRAIFSYSPWRINDTQYSARDARPDSSQLIAQIDGIEHIDDTQKIIHMDIEVPRDCLDTDTDDIYWHELEGMKAITPDGRHIGTIEGLTRQHSNDILLIQTLQKQQLLVPFDERFVIEIDKQSQCVTISWPDEDHHH